MTQNEQGILVDLSDRSCDDAALKRLLPYLNFFPSVAELQLRGTTVTDAGLDAIGITLHESKLQKLDATDSKTTSTGLMKLKRTLGELEIVEAAA